MILELKRDISYDPSDEPDIFFDPSDKIRYFL